MRLRFIHYFLFLGFFFLITEEIGASNSKLLLFDDLNFSCETSRGTARSGKDGNIYVWKPDYIDSSKGDEMKRFDVSDFHRRLSEEEEKCGTKSNVVIAGITFLIHKDDDDDKDNFYCLESIVPPIGKNIDKKNVANFESGIATKNPQAISSNKYAPYDVFASKMKSKEEYVKEYYAVCVRYNMSDYYKDASDNYSNFDFNSKDFDNSLKSLKVIPQYGSFTDSEQYLLYHLNKSLIDESGAGVAPQVFSKYYTEINNYLKKELPHKGYIKGNNPADIEKDALKIVKKAQEVAQLYTKVKQYDILGAILHIHSRLELCLFCANSFLSEFSAEKAKSSDSFVFKLKNYMKANSNEQKDGPFFIPLVSYRLELEKISDPSVLSKLRPPSAISSFPSKELKEPINLLGLIANGGINSLPIKRIRKDG